MASLVGVEKNSTFSLISDFRLHAETYIHRYCGLQSAKTALMVKLIKIVFFCFAEKSSMTSTAGYKPGKSSLS